MSAPKKPGILIVEDSPEDFEAAERALRRVGFEHEIEHCSDGDLALDFLFRRGEYAAQPKAPLPFLVLLDLNLPGTNGQEVLNEVKGDAELRNVPVVVFTSSGQRSEIDACYRAGANSYVQKPADLTSLVGVMDRLTRYWFETVTLPEAKG